MNESITLVSAFFDIGRKVSSTLPRDNEKYFRYFEFWARLKNNLVVYTEPQFKERIIAIRESFGLKERTKVITIDNLYGIEEEIFAKMVDVSGNMYFKAFRLLPNALSGNPKYSYLMFLKMWFVNDAVRNQLTNRMVAWIDFGFNHGGDLYINPEEFDFEWKYDFTEKIHLFALRSPDNVPVFEIVRKLDDYFMGALMVIPASLAEVMWLAMKNAMTTLLDVGMIDDDQLLLILAYRKQPSYFQIHYSNWFLPLKEYGGENLVSLRHGDNEGGTFKKILRKMIRKYVIIKSKHRIVKEYLRVTKKVLHEKNEINK